MDGEPVMLLRYLSSEETYEEPPQVLSLERTQEESPLPTESSSHSILADDQGNSDKTLKDGESVYDSSSTSGILDEEAVERGMSLLGRSASGTQHVFLKLTLPGLGIADIGILSEYIHLQRIEIPHNNIVDLSPLSTLTHLVYLDASHNQIDTLLNFKAPLNLKEVNLSFNRITEMVDISVHHALSILTLDNNEIKVIEGLQSCHRLTRLSLAHNKIEQIENLQYLPLKYLNLSGNLITEIKNIETLKYLQETDLSGNQISCLKGIDNHNVLETIDIEDNCIENICEIQYLVDLPLLRNLNMRRNPIEEIQEYRLPVLFKLQTLTELDRRKVDVQEKIAAITMFKPPAEVIAARDHIKHVVYSFLQPSKINESTLPSIDTPYPMLILVGPSASGKKQLALRLVDDFPEYFGYGVCYTTKPLQQGEEDGKDFHFVTEEKFQDLISQGMFIETYEYNEFFYGLTLDSVEAIAAEGLACVVHMECEGVLSLKNTYFEPRYVLTIPMTRQRHEERLRSRDCFTDEHINNALNRVNRYVTLNQDNPGFFDMTINTDNLTEAYVRLCRLVMEYLGINTEEKMDSQSVTSESQQQSQESAADSSPSYGKTKQSAEGGQRPGKGPIDEASYHRRVLAAKAAAADHVISPSSQLADGLGPPYTAPAVLGGVYSLDNDDSPQINEMEDISSERTSDTSFSKLSSARRISPPLIDGKEGVDIDPTRSSESRKSGKSGHQKSSPRAGSAGQVAVVRPVSAGRNIDDDGSVLMRPGSETRQVLPPIPTNQSPNVTPDDDRLLPEY